MRLGFLSVLFLPLVFAAGGNGREDLDQAELNMLKDPGGWELISMSDQDAGIQTEHTCFDGKPHPETCKGTLMFREDGTFAQNVYIHQQQVSRHGTYQLNGDQLAFYDEFGTRDGPYSTKMNAEKKTLVLEMPQVRLELELETEYQSVKSGKGAEGAAPKPSQLVTRSASTTKSPTRGR